MSRTLFKLGERRGRSRLRCERLEARLLCAGVTGGSPNGPDFTGGQTPADTSTPFSPFLTVLATDPAPNAHVRSPTVIALAFDRAVDPSTLGLDLVLDRVADDGTLTPLLDTGQVVFSEALDPSGTKLLVTMSPSLAPGHYRFFISGLSGLMGLDGSMLNSNGSDQSLGDFWVVAPQGVTIGDSLNLGTLGSNEITKTGALNLQTNQADVKLYKFTLPDTHFWRVGLEVTAERDGSSLDSALALFDSKGKPLATDEIGRRDFPADPYLYAGLEGGTYYIGVSGRGNLPGKPGGYDLKTGSAGSVPQNQSGGSFTLHAVADPADRAISLQSLALDRSDQLDASPTGLTLSFSGALDVSNANGSIGIDFNQGIEVVDQSGRTWPVEANSYSESDVRVSFLFSNRLPPGLYTVRIPQHGGLIDLAGLHPVAPGQASGTLGTFTVDPNAERTDPYDLGALLPNAAVAGITRYALLDPGESVTYRVVITVPGVYTLSGSASGGALAIAITGAQKSVTLGQGDLTEINPKLIPLSAGVSFIELTASGAQPVLAIWSLRIPSSSQDSLLENGVGQGRALNLRLIAPTVLIPDPQTSPIESTLVPVAPTRREPNAPATTGTASVVASSSAGPSGFIDTLGDLVGRPNSAYNHVSAVGEGGLAAAVSLADPSARDYQNPSLSLMTMRAEAGTSPAHWLRPGTNQILSETALITNGAMVAESETASTEPVEFPSLEPARLELVLAALDPQLKDFEQTEPEPLGANPDSPALASNNSDESPQESGDVAQSGLSSPIFAGMAAGLLLSCRHSIRRWLSRGRRSRIAQSSRASRA